MTADIINLRRARKAARRDAADEAAAAQRLRHGMSKADKAKAAKIGALHDASLNGAKIERAEEP